MKLPSGMVYNVREIFTIRELVESSAELFSERTAFLRHAGDGVEEITYARMINEIRAYATYLNSLGLEGKKIAVIGKNSYEWALTYLTVCAGVGVILPIDKELKGAEIENILNDSGADAIVYSKDVAHTVESLSCDIKLIPANNMPEYVKMGERLIEEGDMSYAHHKVDPNALGILIYTSGTTGVAKGVMLSQYNVCSNIVHVCRRLYVSLDDRVLSVLPLHHTYECMAGFLTPIYSGCSIAYNESLRTLLTDFKLFRPTVFVTVPLIVEKFHSTILKKYSSFFGGRAILGAQRALAAAFGEGSGIPKKIFSEIHETFGGRLRMFLCGAASLSPNVFRDMNRFGFSVYVGYGLTETAPVCIMHNDSYQSPDDIGYPIVGVDARIVDPNEDGVGELAVRGANVMLGYYNQPEETAKVIHDGWFFTGDLASVADNGAYRIVGRIKSMIVTKNGKKIFPEELEYYLDKNKYISESMVYGTSDASGETIVGVSLFPNYDAVNAELSRRGIEAGTPEYDKELRDMLSVIVKDVNKKLPQFKMIRKIVVRDHEFEKTTTKKIKRFAADNISGT